MSEPDAGVAMIDDVVAHLQHFAEGIAPNVAMITHSIASVDDDPVDWITVDLGEDNRIEIRADDADLMELVRRAIGQLALAALLDPQHSAEPAHTHRLIDAAEGSGVIVVDQARDLRVKFPEPTVQLLVA